MIKPLRNYVLLKRLEIESNSPIQIPTQYKEPSDICEVVAVGPGKKANDGSRLPMTVKEGDKILLLKYSGAEVEHDGQDYLMVQEPEIIAVL
jgi:chaperonin GroES